MKNKICIVNLVKKDKGVIDNKDIDSLNEIVRLLNKFDIKLEFQQHDANKKYQTIVKVGNPNSKIEKENVLAWKSYIEDAKKVFNKKSLNDPNLIIFSCNGVMSIARNKSEKNSIKYITPFSKK